jgi:putative SOS response-associated peptidase YedK
MCSRFYLFTSSTVVADLFELTRTPDLLPHYNIAPSQPVAAVRLGENGRELIPLRWGLVPMARP